MQAEPAEKLEKYQQNRPAAPKPQRFVGLAYAPCQAAAMPDERLEFQSVTAPTGKPILSRQHNLTSPFASPSFPPHSPPASPLRLTSPPLFLLPSRPASLKASRMTRHVPFSLSPPFSRRFPANFLFSKTHEFVSLVTVCKGPSATDPVASTARAELSPLVAIRTQPITYWDSATFPRL